MGVGAYFAYVRHPFLIDSDQLCKKLVDDVSVLTLPGTMFVPKEDHSGKRQIRIAFANIDAKKIKTLLIKIMFGLNVIFFKISPYSFSLL